MADPNELIGPFRRNFRQLATAFADSSLTVRDSYDKLKSWLDWIITHKNGRATTEHIEYVYYEGIPLAARSLLHRRYVANTKEEYAATKHSLQTFVTYVMEACRADGSRSEPSLAFARLLDPFQPLYMIGQANGLGGKSWAELRGWPTLTPAATIAQAAAAATTGQGVGGAAMDTGEQAKTGPVIGGEPLRIGQPVSVAFVDLLPYPPPIDADTQAQLADGMEEEEAATVPIGPQEAHNGTIDEFKYSIQQYDAIKAGAAATWLPAVVVGWGAFPESEVRVEVHIPQGMLIAQDGPRTQCLWINEEFENRLTRPGNTVAGAPPLISAAPAASDPISLRSQLHPAEQQWRASLEPGSSCDLWDDRLGWCASRVLDASDSVRGVPCATGSLLCVRADGLTHGCEQRLDRYSSRLAPLNAWSNGRKASGFFLPSPLAESPSERDCCVSGPPWIGGTPDCPPVPNSLRSTTGLPEGVATNSVCETYLRVRKFSATAGGRAFASAANDLYPRVWAQLCSQKLFAERGFFPVLSAIVESAKEQTGDKVATTRPSFPAVVALIESFGRIADAMNPSDGPPQLLTVTYEKTLSYLRSLTVEDVKEVTRESVAILLSGLCRIAHALNASTSEGPNILSNGSLARGTKLYKAYHACELTCVLGLAAACLRSESVLKRRDGLLILHDTWACLEGAECSPPGIQRVVNSKTGAVEYKILPVLHTLDAAAVAAYFSPLPSPSAAVHPKVRLTSSGLDLLLDVCVHRQHTEAVRQCGPLLLILASAGVLTAPALEAVWSACWRTAEEDARAAVSMLSETIPALPSQACSHILELSLASGGTHWPVHTAALYEALACKPAGAPVSGGGAGLAGMASDTAAAGVVQHRALAALYCLVLGISPISMLQTPHVQVLSAVQALARSSGTAIRHEVSSVLSEKAADAFIRALAHPTGASARITYARLCILRIAQCLQGSKHLSILRRIVTEAFPKPAVQAGLAAVSGAASAQRFDLSQVSSGKGKGKKVSPNSQQAQLVAAAKLFSSPAFQQNVAAILGSGSAPPLPGATTAVPSSLTPATGSPATEPAVVGTESSGPTLQESIAALQHDCDVLGVVHRFMMAVHTAGREAARTMELKSWAESCSFVSSSQKADTSLVDQALQEVCVALSQANRESLMKQAALAPAFESLTAGSEFVPGLPAESVQLRVFASTANAQERVEDCISSCLSVVGLLLCSSHLSLSQATAEEMWDQLVDHALTRNIRRTALALFIKGVRGLATCAGPVGIRELKGLAGDAHIDSSSRASETLSEQGSARTTSAPSAASGASPTDAYDMVEEVSVQQLRLRAGTPTPPYSEQSAVGLMFSPETAEYIFRTRMDTPAWASRAATAAMDLIAFTAWRTFFVFLSGRRRSIAYSGTRLLETGAPAGSTEELQNVLDAFAFPAPASGLPTQSVGNLLGQAGLVSLTAEPSGVDTLWTIALSAQEPAVASAAVYLLTALQRRPAGRAGSPATSGASSRRAYIQRALHYLHAALPAPSSPVEKTAYALPILADSIASSMAADAGRLSSHSPSIVSRRPSGVMHAAPQTDSGPELLLQRCVSILKAVLDSAEDEAVEIQQRLLTCSWAAFTLQSNGVQLPEAVVSDLLRARAYLEYGAHSGTASDLFGTVHPASVASDMASQTTAALRACPVSTLRIVCLNLPQAAVRPQADISTGSEAGKPADVPRLAPMNGDMLIRVRGDETVRSFRARLCVALGVPSASVRVTVGGVYGGTLGQAVILHGDWLGHSIASLRLKPDAQVTVVGLSTNAAENSSLGTAWMDWCASLRDPAVLASQLSKTVAEAELSPASLLAADADAISTLLQVVQIASRRATSLPGGGAWPAVAAAAWSLLCRLPTAAHLTTWAAQGQAMPPSLWKALLSCSGDGITGIYCALYLRKLLLDGPLIGAALAKRVLQSGVGDTNATDAATAAYAQHSLNEPVYTLLLSSPTDLSTALGLRPRLVEKTMMTASMWSQEGRTQPDRQQLSIDYYTHKVCTETLPSFSASGGYSLLLDALQSCWTRAVPSTDAIATTLGAVLLDILRQLVQRSVLPEAGTSAVPWPQLDLPALRRVSTVVLNYLGTSSSSASSSSAVAEQPTPGAALHAWTLLEGISLWSTCIQAQPSLWPELITNPSDAQALTSMLTALVPSGPRALQQAGDQAVTLACATANALCRIACSMPGREAVEWLLQWCIHSRPRPCSADVSLAAVDSWGQKTSSQAVRDTIVSVHYALLDCLLRRFVLCAYREQLYIRTPVSPASSRVLPGKTPESGQGEGVVDTDGNNMEAAPLPPSLQLPKELKALLEELVADIRACPHRESSWHSVLCMRAIEEHPVWRVTLEGTEASWEEPKPGLKRGYRTMEEISLSRAIAVARGDADTAQLLSEGPSPPTQGASGSALEQARNAFFAVNMDYALHTAALYSLTPMDPRFACLGVEAEVSSVMEQFGQTVDVLIESGLPALQQAQQDKKIRNPQDYVPFAQGSPTSGLASHDGSQRGLAPVADLVSVLCPRPYDSLCNITGVDTFLLGCLRAATVLMEADPVTAAQVCHSSDLLTYLYSDCLAGPTAMSSKSYALDHALTKEQDKLGASGVGMDYAPPVSAGPKCATLVTRRAAFGLLRAAVRRSPLSAAAVLQVMNQQAVAHWQGAQPAVQFYANDWKLQLSSADLRSPEGYAGLRNMGCTCYMNSLLQQFFMCEPLRYGVLAVMDVADPAAYRLSTSMPELSALICQREKGFAKLLQPVSSMNRRKIGVGKDGHPLYEEIQGSRAPNDAEVTQRCIEERKESFLYQLQRIFAGLELTTRRAWNPQQWMLAYKDLDGQPTNPTMQQDAQEFLTTFLDRLEDSLADTPRAGLVQSVLGCSTREVRTCSGGCGTVRTNTDTAVCLSMPVAPGSLEAALSLEYEKWEEVTDYACEACKRKTTLRKRTTIDSLSDTLIVHLKRFSMNYETGQPLKINTRFTFPASMDLHAYSYEALAGAMSTAAGAGTSAVAPPAIDRVDRSRWQYDLVGVVVHMGNLDSGHYYSYIKERGARASIVALQREAVKLGSSWSAGQPVPPELQAAAARAAHWFEFNDSVVSEWDPVNMDNACFGSSDESQPAVRSAYMLVYERVHPVATAADSGVLTVPKASKPPAVHMAAVETDKALRAALLREDFAQKGGSDESGSLTGSRQGNHKRARLGAGGDASSPRPAGAQSSLTSSDGATGSIVPVAIVPRDSYGRGPLPLSHLIEVQQDEYSLQIHSNSTDREMGALLMLLADTVSRQATHMPLLAATPCPLPPLPHALPLLDGDDVSTGQPLAAEVLLRPLITIGYTGFIRSVFGCERVPAPNAVTLVHLLCRIVGLRRDAARVLLQDVQAAEHFNSMQHGHLVANAVYQPDKVHARQEIPADVVLPKLTGRLSHTGAAYYGGPREELGWWRSVLSHGPTPMARLATAKLFATAFLRLALPVAELIQWQALWMPGSVAEMNEADYATGSSKLYAHHDVFLPGAGRLAEHMADAQLVADLTADLARQDVFDHLCVRWAFAEAYWTFWWDVCRGGFCCGLPLPLSDPSASSLAEPCLLVEAVDDSTAAVVDGQGASVLSARLQASTLWAEGSSLPSALGPRAAILEGVPTIEKGQEHLPPSETVFRAAAVGAHLLRMSIADGRADLRAVLLQYLLQLRPQDYDKLAELDMTEHPPLEGFIVPVTRLARLVATPGTLPKVNQQSFLNKTTNASASLRTAYELYSLLARSVAPPACHGTEYCAPVPFTTVGITPQPLLLQSPSPLVDLVLEASNRAGDVQDASATMTSRLLALHKKLAQPTPRGKTASAVSSGVESWDVAVLWTRYRRLKAGSTWAVAAKFCPQLERVQEKLPQSDNGEAYMPSFAMGRPVDKGGLSGAAPVFPRLHTHPCPADADLILRSQLRAAFLYIAHARFKEARTNGVLPIRWDWQSEYALYQARVSSHVLQAGKGYKRHQDALIWHSLPKAAAGATSATLLDTFLPEIANSSRGIALACPATVFHAVLEKSLVDAANATQTPSPDVDAVLNLIGALNDRGADVLGEEKSNDIAIHPMARIRLLARADRCLHELTVGNVRGQLSADDDEEDEDPDDPFYVSPPDANFGWSAESVALSFLHSVSGQWPSSEFHTWPTTTPWSSPLKVDAEYNMPLLSALLQAFDTYGSSRNDELFVHACTLCELVLQQPFPSRVLTIASIAMAQGVYQAETHLLHMRESQQKKLKQGTQMTAGAYFRYQTVWMPALRLCLSSPDVATQWFVQRGGHKLPDPGSQPRWFAARHQETEFQLWHAVEHALSTDGQPLDGSSAWAKDAPAAGAGKDSKPAALPTLPAWAIAAVDPDNVFLGLPSYLMPTQAEIEASLLANPLAKRKSVLLTLLAVGPLTGLTPREEALVVDQLQPTYGIRALICLARLHRVLTASNTPSLESIPAPASMAAAAAGAGAPGVSTRRQSAGATGPGNASQAKTGQGLLGFCAYLAQQEEAASQDERV